MTGMLTVPHFGLKVNPYGEGWGGALVLAKPTGSSVGDLVLDYIGTQFRLYDGSGNNKGVYVNIQNAADGAGSKIYHTNDKPTPAEIGALNASYLNTRGVANANDCNTQGITVNYLAMGASNKPDGTDHALLTLSHDGAWSTQMASDWRTNKWYVRTQAGGT